MGPDAGPHCLRQACTAPLDLALQYVRDEQRVKTQRLDEREPDDHPRTNLRLGVGIAPERLHRRRRKPALSHSASECRDTHREAGAERDQARP